METGKALNGKPYAGNPHVRFDEGAGASRHSGRSALLYNMRKMIALTAVAASVAIPVSANADTVTTNGFTWIYSVNNAANKTVTLGDTTGNTSSLGVAIGTYNDVAITADDIPWTFIDPTSGNQYTVTELAGYAVRNCRKMTGVLKIPASITKIGTFAFQSCASLTGALVIPDAVNCSISERGSFWGCASVTAIIMGSGVTSLGRQTFCDCPKATGAWVKGRPTATSGTQAVTTINQNGLFQGASSLKVCILGRNTKFEAYNATGMFPNVTGCTMFYPASAAEGVTLNANSVKLLCYGPGQDLDIEINDGLNVLTATPTTVDMLTNVLAQASTFKSAFGLDTHISVTNAIDLTGVTITEDMLKSVTFDRLVFAAKTQAQLTNILGAFPATTPISIDPTGLTENMVIPETYNNVYVKTVPGVTIKRTASGLMIVVK